MRRSDRLLEILEILQDGRLHRARDIAERLEVSLRTIYRDMDTLVATGAPIDGERGVGYLMRGAVFLPPLGVTLLELEALHLGMAIVGAAADPELQSAARSLQRKIEKVSDASAMAPKSWGVGVYPFAQAELGFVHMPLIRRAIREKEILEITYTALDGGTSTRCIRPLEAAYWGRVWTLTAWCDLRGGFRAFRIDRIQECSGTKARFADEAGKTLAEYLTLVDAQMAREKAATDDRP
jgi:predicted DNA-binding transcriptional regulator YafY